MTPYEAAKQICETGRRLYFKDMCAANDGNISVRLSDGTILATPTGVCKGYMEPEDMVRLSPEGDILSPGGRPSSEIKMHLAVYGRLKDVNAVVHAHPVYSTSFAAAGLDMSSPILIESVEQFDTVPCVRYAAPSTSHLADSILPFLEGRRALLLEFHGALTYASDLTKAWMKMESLEFYARVLFNHMMLGSENILSPERRSELLRIKEKLKIE